MLLRGPPWLGGENAVVFPEGPDALEGRWSEHACAAHYRARAEHEALQSLGRVPVRTLHASRRNSSQQHEQSIRHREAATQPPRTRNSI